MVRHDTYTNCYCPHCKNSLNEVATTTPACPLCNQSVDPQDVWLTRRAPGEIDLPGWLRAFGWPFLFLVAGATPFVLKVAGHWNIPNRGWIMLAGEIAFAIGLIRFLYRLASGGEDPW